MQTGFLSHSNSEILPETIGWKCVQENVSKTTSIVGDFKIPPKSYESLAISVMGMINSERQTVNLDLPSSF